MDNPESTTESPAAAAAPMGPIPNRGRIVHYRLSEVDVESINTRRHQYNGLLAGNPVKKGDVFPMLITEDWGAHGPQAVNGQVFLDGNDTLWVTSRMVGEESGSFFWPIRA
jgi:hypothetical protein